MRITLGGKQECKEARNEGGKEGRKEGWMGERTRLGGGDVDVLGGDVIGYVDPGLSNLARPSNGIPTIPMMDRKPVVMENMHR